MKTIVKIDPEKEYESAKKVISSLALTSDSSSDLATLDGSVDNLKTVINVLIERATPKKKKKHPKNTRRRPRNDSKLRKDFDKLPSQKFPDLAVKEQIIRDEKVPKCPCCQKEMKEAGLYKTAEKLEVIPKQYYIIRNKRVIYNCSACHGSMLNAASVPSISRNSNYGDSLIIDCSLSKYCDLIPIDRYSAIAAREGLEGLPPNSLITLTHTLSDFLEPVYNRVKCEVQSSDIVYADETPHKMLEGDSTSNWYLWGFSSLNACVFEAHDTRGSKVPLKFLSDSSASKVMTDGYGAYKKALKELAKIKKIIVEAYCNAHAYRYFRDASTTWTEEAEPFLELYGRIYSIERSPRPVEEKLLARQEMMPLFNELKSKCELAKSEAMPSSTFEKAINYFLNHFPGLTRCLSDINIPLDNNFSERLLRSPVLGRKTWYGNHSKRGAKTSAVLFSLVETCKINQINPRSYFVWICQRVHKKEKLLTPFEYSRLDTG